MIFSNTKDDHMPVQTTALIKQFEEHHKYQLQKMNDPSLHKSSTKYVVDEYGTSLFGLHRRTIYMPSSRPERQTKVLLEQIEFNGIMMQPGLRVT